MQRTATIVALFGLALAGCEQSEPESTPAAAVAPDPVPKDLYIEAKSAGPRVAYEITLDASRTLSFSSRRRTPRSEKISDEQVLAAIELVREFQTVDTSAIPAQCPPPHARDRGDVRLTVRMNGKTTSGFYDGGCPETEAVRTMRTAVARLRRQVIPADWRKIAKKPPKPKESPRTTLVTEQEVDQVMTRYKSRFNTCAAMHEQPPGDVRIEFTVQSNGRSNFVKFPDDGVEGTKRGDCLEKVVAAMVFPRTDTHMETHFVRTLELP